MAHIAVILALLLVLAVLLVRKSGRPLWTWAGVVLLLLLSWGVAALWLGLFEGVYNHILKDVLYFVGLAPARWRMLYPSTLYEAPGDWLFELTGILQAPLGLLAGWRGWQLLRAARTA